MTDLERIKKDVVEMDSRANVCWYDTKVLTKAVRLILEELTADRKTEQSNSEIPNNSKVSEIPTGSEPQTERKCIDCKFLTYMFGKTWCNIKCDNPHDKVCDRWQATEPQTERSE